MLAAFEGDIRRELQAAGGDDYELCFTAPPGLRTEIERAAGDCGTRVTRVGRIVEGSGVLAIGRDGRAWSPGRTGYQHFA